MNHLEALRTIAEYPASAQDDMQAANMRKIAQEALAGDVERLRSGVAREIVAAIGAANMRLLRTRDGYRIEPASQAYATKAQPAVEPVAHRIMRRRPDGEWVNDGRYWCDGAPSADLATSIPSLGDGWRIDYAYASPAPAPNALDAETVKKARRYDWLRDFHNGPEGVQDNLPYISAGADNDLVWALIGPDADVGIDAAIAARS